jgi:RNA polymerase sigma-70 factor (ECF subfamily)
VPDAGPDAGAGSLAEMLDERQHLLGIALWMFGSAGTAEWIVQETYRRWYTLDDAARSDILLPKAWLTRAAAEISMELLDTDPTPAPAPGPVVPPVPRPASTSDLAAHDHVARRFAAACAAGDVAGLTAVMAADAVVVCDGGGKVRAPVRPIRGGTEVARFVSALLSGRAGDVLTVEPVNGRAGLALRRAGRAVAVVSVSLADTEVTAVWIVLNPDKLHGWHRH